MSESGGNRLQSGLAWWPLAIGALLLDQATKWLVQAELALHESIRILPVLDLLHARNYGAAFSFLDIPGGAQRWVFTTLALVVSGVIVAALRRVPATQRLQCAGLMLIVSGALGNAIDRVRFGYVVDFVGVHWNSAWFPAFNVADSCITVGAGLILLEAFMEWRRERGVAREG
ncbi:MAG: signal peptidase II [Steroidobacteraceae bacterium]